MAKPTLLNSPEEVKLKKCSKCEGFFLLTEFNFVGGKYKDQLRTECKECQGKYVNNWAINNRDKTKKNQKNYRSKKPKKYIEGYTKRNELFRCNLEKKLFYSAKRRAKIKNLPFNLTVEDIIVPPKCPVLGIPLKLNRGCSSFDSPSLDRIIPSKGYTRGNIIVVSHKANTIKNNATVEEIEKVLNFYRNILRG